MNEADYTYNAGMDASDYDEYLSVMSLINSPSILDKIKNFFTNLLTYSH